MNKSQIQVLLIEDNPVDVIFLREALGQDALNSFDLVTVERLQSALVLLQENTFDVILLDLGLPDIQGFETYTRIQQAVPQVPKVILSGLTDEALALQVVQAGAQDYIVKGTSGFASAARAIRHAIERQQAQAAVRASEERFRALIEHGSDDISLLDAEGNLLWESPAVVRNLGYPENTFVGHNIFELIHPDDRAWTNALYADLVQKPGGRRHGIFRLQHADGSWRWVEATLTNMLENPSVYAVVANYHDITERKEAEDTIRSLARFPEENPNPILRIGKDGQIIYANAASSAWLAGWKVSLNDSLPEEWWLPVADAYQRDTKENLELSVQDRIYSILIVPFQESGYINIYGREITESKLAEEKLRENAADEALINSLNEAANRGESLEALIKLLGTKFETMFSAKGTGLYLLSADGKSLNMPGFSLPEGVVRNLEKLIGREIPPLQVPIRAGGTFQKFLQAEGGTILTDPQELQIWMTEFTGMETVPTGLQGLISKLLPKISRILGVRSTISLPLRSAGKTIGLLGISSANVLGQQQLERLRKISTQLASAIQRKQAELAVKQNSEDLALINLLNETINRRESLGTLVRVLEQEFQRLFNTKGTALYLLSEDGRTLNMPGVSLPREIAGKIEKLIGRAFPAIQIPVKPDGLFHRLIHTPQGTITTEPLEIQQWISEFTETESLPASLKPIIKKLVPQIYKLLDIKSVISLPLTVGGKAIGVLDVSSAHELSVHDLERFQKIGGQLSAGILRHQDEQKLRESNERFRQLSDNIQESFWITDATSDEEIYISPPAEKIWGRSVKNMLDTPNAFLESVLPEDRPKVLRALAEQKNGQRTETEYRIVRPDGSVRWIWDRAFPIFDDAGRVVRLAGVAADVTERKQNEQKLLESNERFEQLANNIEEAFWITSTRTREEIYLSPATEKIWGMPIEALKQPNAFLEHVLPEDRGLVEAVLVRQDLGEKTEIEYRIRAQDGTIRWIWDRSFPIFDADGELLHNAGLSTDITEIKETQHELEVLNRTLETRVDQRTAEVQDLYDKAPCGYHSLDKDGVFVKVNQTELDWLGYTRAELIGIKNIRDLITPQSQLVFDTSFSRLVEQGWVNDLEFEMIRKDGSILPVLLNAVAIFDADNTHLQSRSTIFDITARRKVEEALRASEEQLRSANVALEKAARLKDEFMASMSHELRTPLNAILGLSESLSEQAVGPLTEKQQKYVQTINESGRHLLHLINDILDLAKIEAGQIVLDLAKVDLRTVCESSLTMVRHLATKKNQQIEFQMDEKINWIHADARSLKQMLVNLLSNAIKFTPPGGKLGLIVHSDPAEQRVLLTVWDNGIGIDEGDLKRLFQPFVQLNAGLARENTGTGLGLALVARMARLHGGSVGVVSRPGQGARFNIILPWEPVSEGEAMAKLMVTGKFKAINLNAQDKKTILLVEDTDTVILLLKDFLELSGYKVEVARSGYEAIAQAERVLPDLILMDVQMPSMDGLEAARIIRKTRAVKDIPIIALTALAMPGDRERCLAAGMNEYISKPINLKNFIKTIQNVLSKAQEARPA